MTQMLKVRKAVGVQESSRTGSGVCMFPVVATGNLRCLVPDCRLNGSNQHQLHCQAWQGARWAPQLLLSTQPGPRPQWAENEGQPPLLSLLVIFLLLFVYVCVCVLVQRDNSTASV